MGRQYSMPYVIYTTGIAWRNDEVSEDIAAMDNPWDVFWDPKYKGQAHLLNGSRDTLAVGLLRKGYDPNESDQTILDQVKQDLLAGADEMGWKYDHVDYTELSTNLWQVHNTWSGQMAYYQYYLPKGLDITALSYAWPPQGQGGQKGLISHDLFAIPKGAASPVLAHALIDYLYDPKNAIANYSYEGLPAHGEVVQRGRRGLRRLPVRESHLHVSSPTTWCRWACRSWSWNPRSTSCTSRSTKK